MKLQSLLSIAFNKTAIVHLRDGFSVLRGSTESQVTCILLMQLSGVAYLSDVQDSKPNLENNTVLNGKGKERKDDDFVSFSFT